MKGWNPKDWLALGLLGFIYIYLLLVIMVTLVTGRESNFDQMEIGKEIIVFIVGVIAGYLGNNIKNNNNG